MPRKAAVGPSKLSQILKHLQSQPILVLPSLRSLRLTYALRNDHFGARHFVKDDLPRIAYANPQLKIIVNRVEKKIEDTLTPEMRLEFRDGSHREINMDQKWSSAILAELLEIHNKFNAQIMARGGDSSGKTEQRKGGEREVFTRAVSGSKRTPRNAMAA